MEEHANSMPVQQVAANLEMTNLEADRWKLCKTRVEYDLQVLRVAKSKLSSWESAHYHQKLLHRQQAWDNSFRGAEAFLNGNASFICTDKVQQGMQEMMAFQDRWSTSLGIRKEGLDPRRQIFDFISISFPSTVIVSLKCIMSIFRVPVVLALG